jgi:hypothetical protein
VRLWLGSADGGYRTPLDALHCLNARLQHGLHQSAHRACTTSSELCSGEQGVGIRSAALLGRNFPPPRLSRQLAHLAVEQPRLQREQPALIGQHLHFAIGRRADDTLASVFSWGPELWGLVGVTAVVIPQCPTVPEEYDNNNPNARYSFCNNQHVSVTAV